MKTIVLDMEWTDTCTGRKISAEFRERYTAQRSHSDWRRVHP